MSNARPSLLVAVVLASASVFALLSALQARWARADVADRRVVDTQAILTGPRWYFSETPRGHPIVRRGDATVVVLGRDFFNADGRSAFVVEGHLGTAIGAHRRSARLGASIGFKSRTPSRLELGLAIAIVDHFDPSDLSEITIGGAAIAQLAYDLDASLPYSTRVLLRTELHHPTPSTVTLDAFLGLGTRWP